MKFFNFNNKKETPTAEKGFSFLTEPMSKNIEIPKPVEIRGKDYVTYGKNNSFPLDLLTYLEGSSIHSSIIDAKADLIAGNGLLYAETREQSNEYIVDNWQKIPFWSKADKVFKLVAKDQQIFGYSCFEVIKSMDKTRIADINWIDASRIVVGKRDEYGNINEYYYSDDWSNLYKYPYRVIPAYDPNNNEAVRQLMFISYENNNMDYYSKPKYFSALRWIKADYLMSEYNLGAINNGFSPSIIFKFFKKPTPDERRQVSESITRQHGGASNAGKAIIFFSDGKDLAPEVEPINATNIDQRLLQVADQIVQQIITAHRCHPQLLGIQTPGKLGYSSELIQSWSIFDKMVIRPERKLILDAFKQILFYNGVNYLDIEQLVPIEIMEE
jgi:hypothetical protein